MIHLTNTFSGKKESIVPQKELLMYVCGITPYDHAHIGHGRCYVAFDTIYRLYTHMNISVKYCRNFTDIDDKLLYKAEKQYGDRLLYKKIADEYIESFEKSMKDLNCISPTIEPRVTDNIDHIITFISDLIKTGHAYESDGDVYFDITSYPQYGTLSKQNMNHLIAGARIDVRDNKKNPLDFALWKKEPDNQFWKSPWGYGRPGWHIECSVLAKTYLKEHIDIHGGGLDLLFPHHENERAQSESLYGPDFAKLWVHNGFVTVNKEKMSKSLGNFLTLHDIFTQYDPMVIRYYFLTHHYKAPLEFSSDLLNSASKKYHELTELLSEIEPTPVYDHPIINALFEFLCDDINTPGFFGVFYQHYHTISTDKNLLGAIKYIFAVILGLPLTRIKSDKPTMTPEIERIINERNQARKEKNWKKADELRDILINLGFTPSDDKI